MCTNNENNICEEVTYKRMLNIQSELPHNLKYFKTDFLYKADEELSSKLLESVVEMVELEYGVSIDNYEHVVVLTDEEADKLEQNILDYPNLKGIYVSKNVLLTSSQGV